MFQNQEAKTALEAENYVIGILERQKWAILARNFRRIGCEIDIIALKGQTIIFVEVKYRSYLPPTLQASTQTLSRGKRKALERGASCFLQFYEEKLPHWKTLRFDLALVSSHRGAFKMKYFPGFQ